MVADFTFFSYLASRAMKAELMSLLLTLELMMMLSK